MTPEFGMATFFDAMKRTRSVRRFTHSRYLSWYLIFVLFACGHYAFAEGQTSPAQTAKPVVNEDDTPARYDLLSDEPRAFQWGLHIDSDAVDTLSGGLQRGVVGNNVIHLGIAMDSSALGGWDGGRFVASVMRIDSGQASANYIGDLQVADNTDATPHSGIYQLWYRQIFHDADKGATFKLRGGLIDLNQNFLSVDAASVLLNSSFGVDPTLSANVPVSIYPEPGLGLEAAAQWSQWQWQLGMFQANPAHRNEGFKHGALVIGEMDYQTSAQDDGAAHIAIGFWRYHQSDPALGAYPAHDWGAYAFIEGPLSKAADAPQAFLQLGHAPSASNTVTHYVGLGVQVPSPLKHRPNDVFTAGIAHAEIPNTAAGSETSFEISYRANMCHFAALQPDLQYIRHPSGREDIHNAVVAFIRLHLVFY